MKDILSHPEADTRDALFSGRPSALAATYHLLVQRLDRNLTLPMQDRDSGQVAAMTMEQLQQQQVIAKISLPNPSTSFTEVRFALVQGLAIYYICNGYRDWISNNTSGIVKHHHLLGFTQVLGNIP